MLLPFALLTLAGYVCGATPFGYLAGRLKGIDIRQHGSGNIGATNVIRTLGKGIGIPVFILDVIKGWFPAWLAQHWMGDHGASLALTTSAGIAAGVAAVLGHNFTFWLKGRGGKGIATSAGALLGTAPIAACVGLLTFLIALKICRYVSLSSLIAGAVIPIATAVMMARSGQWNFILLGFGVALCLLAIVRHKANIQRLIAGTEPKVGQKKPQPAAQA
jgi:glycerol-3-phosphate acyltransferase PlsY